MIYTWIHSRTWFREELPWKDYRPILYPTRIEHKCQDCDYTRNMGRRIWWVAHQHTPDSTYKCHACYLKTSNGLPEGYANDSESREKKGAAERSLSHAEKNDPEYISSRREKMREYKYRSYHHNPKFRESVLDSSRRYQTAMMKDPAWRAAHNERTRLYRKSVRKEDPSYVQRDTVCRWIRRDPAAREVMDWGLYKPVLYPIKVEHQCGGCEFTRRGGFKLWFLKQVKGRTESTDSGSTGLHRCPRCFFKDPDGGLPKAFEDCTTQTQLKTRLRELQGSRKG